VRGCFAPQVMRIMSALLEAGVLSARRVALRDDEFTSLELVHRLLLESPASRENETWGYGLVVTVDGTSAGRRQTYRARTQHPPQEQWGGPAAYAKNVGIPLAVAAAMIARKETSGRGVQPAETALPHGIFFRALAERGITLEERFERSSEAVS